MCSQSPHAMNAMNVSSKGNSPQQTFIVTCCNIPWLQTLDWSLLTNHGIPSSWSWIISWISSSLVFIRVCHSPCSFVAQLIIPSTPCSSPSSSLLLSPPAQTSNSRSRVVFSYRGSIQTSHNHFSCGMFPLPISEHTMYDSILPAVCI